MIEHTQRRCKQSYIECSGFACACESTDLFKALKIVHESSSTKLILRMLERQQLQIYQALYNFTWRQSIILCSTVCAHQLQVTSSKTSVASHAHSIELITPVNIAVHFASSPVQSSPVQSSPDQSPGFVPSPC